MELVADDYSISFGKFKCLNTNRVYTITGTKTLHKPEHPHYYDKAIKSEDTVVRDDGVKKVFTRNQMKQRFVNVEEVIDKK